MYEVMLYWETADTDPSNPEYVLEFARIWKSIHKIVFSKTLEQVQGNATLSRGNIAEEITRLKAQPGKNMGVGGAHLAATLMRLGLIDEYWLYIHPVILGSGTPMFPPLDNPIKLRLVETHTFHSGVVSLALPASNGQGARVAAIIRTQQAEEDTMQKFTTFLMFTGQAEEAMNLYTSLFKQSEILNITRYGANEAGAEGTVQHATFTLNGQEFMCIDSSAQHAFTFTPSISLYVRCETEEEIDRVFTVLSQDGQILMPLDRYPFSQKFGWLSDRFGVSWQLSLESGSRS